MKTYLIIISILFSTTGLFSQTTYVLTNYTSDNYWVDLDIASSNPECDFNGSPPSRQVNNINLRPDGCSGNTIGESLSPDEFVYKVTISDMTGCSTSCNPTGSKGSIVTVLEPCTNNPASDTWNTCASDKAESDRTTYLNIDD